jgi:raffinose/stachyose/melibiose transport system permease protein
MGVFKMASMGFSKKTPLKKINAGFLLLLPTFILYTAVIIYPLINMIYTSFFKWNGIPSQPYVFVGLDNYIYFFNDYMTITALKNVGIMMISGVLGVVPISLFLAHVINKNFFGLRFVKSSYFLPVIINKVAIGLMFTFILYPKVGPFAVVLDFFGLDSSINLLGSMKYAMWATAFVMVWCNTGLHMVIYSSAMASFPNDIYESAIIDGASSVQKFFNITLPLLKGTINVSIVLILTNAFRVFDLIIALTGGGPGSSTEVLTTILYKNAFYFSRFAYADAIGVITVVCSLIITVLINKILYTNEN